jgi:hypothetical protein
LTDSSQFSDTKVCSNRTDCTYFTSRHNFSEISMLTDSLSLIHFTKGTVYHSFNILNAFLILENCKNLVYEGYDMMRDHFEGNIRLLAGETDSLRMQIYDPQNNFLTKMAQLRSKISLGYQTHIHFMTQA